MPKNDTLDALGDVMTTTLTTILTTILTTNLNNQIWQPILTTNLDYQPWLPTLTRLCQKYAQYMPKVCPRYAQKGQINKWKLPFPHSRFDHFQRPKQKSKTTLNRNITLISGKYGLRNHFWPLESGFSQEQKWEKGAWSYETPPTPFYRSTRSQNSCQIEFLSRNGREISGSVFWND